MIDWLVRLYGTKLALSFIGFTVFGVGLCRLSTGGETGSAPSVVLRLVQEIEQRAATTPSLDLYRLYRTTTPSAETIAQLCLQLSAEPGTLANTAVSSHLICNRTFLYFRFFPTFTKDGGGDLSLFEPHVLASGLKKLLRELPDPLVPSQWYDAFIDASRKMEGDLF